MSILSGLKIIEIEGIGPAPFCGMHLADLGADVVLIARPRRINNLAAGDEAVFRRGKSVVTLDLKKAEDVKALKALIAHADGLIEGMRPGVMERLGLGPDICRALNPKLVYGRVTGWGQSGPLSRAAGHDNNYAALSGALWYSGRAGTPPVAPPTLIGDVAGGALYLTIGMLAGLMQALKTGKGETVDAAMVDGTAHMMNLVLSAAASGLMGEPRGTSFLDGPHFYETYLCKAGGYVTIGALEPQFYALLLQKLGLADDPDFQSQLNSKIWPEQKAKLAKIMASKTQSQWREILEGTDVCFAPVLAPSEAAQHPHMKARSSYFSYEGNLEAAPAPKFSNSGAPFERRAAQKKELSEMIKLWKSE